MNAAEVLQLLQNYQPQGEKETQDHAYIVDFVQRESAFTNRKTVEGHLTASAWITNATRDRAVLLHHRKLDIWVQPGGHIDADDPSLIEASLREATEETGLSELTPVSEQIFDLDIHSIPARKDEPDHLHLDIRFWFKTQDQELVLSEESNDLSWMTAEEIQRVTDEESVLRMMRKSLLG
jgi:8-oxo-dGTP pyrophosphatase MutT (NUDIX family)